MMSRLSILAQQLDSKNPTHTTQPPLNSVLIQLLPGNHEQKDRSLPDPGCEKDSIVTSQNMAEVPQYVGVACCLQPNAETGHHEEDVGENVNLQKNKFSISHELVLCISTSQRVLCLLFAGRNHFFSIKTSFSIFFRNKRKKERKMQKNKKTCTKGVYQCLGVYLPRLTQLICEI